MFTPNLEHYLDYKTHHQDLLREAGQERLAVEAMKAVKIVSRDRVRILAWVGKGLVGLGARLEERYGVQPETARTLNQQSSAGGC